MTDEYALDCLISMKLSWRLDTDTGYYIAEAGGGVELRLKGSSRQPIALHFVRRGQQYIIAEPRSLRWSQLTPLQQKLATLIEQAEQQCVGRDFAEETRKELLSDAIGWRD